LLLSIDPSHELYPYIQSWPLPSKSSETLLVRREANEVVYLNQLRFDKREPLSIHLPISSEDLPAAKAVMGKEEVMDGLDYRGVAVVAALRRVPDSPWYLVAKMDATEIYAPLRERLWSVVALVAALLIGASAGVGLIWRQHSAAFYKERLRIELEKSRSDDRYRELVQNANSAIIRWRSDGIITFFNEYAQTFFGYPGDEAIGRHISTLLPDSDSGGSDLSGLIADIVQSPERFISNDNENVCRDGRRVWMSWTNKPILDDRGKVVEILAVGSDMTARKQAEEALLASKAKLEAALDSMTDAVFISDSEGRFIEFNESFATFHRFKSKEECARTFADYPALLDVFMANGEPAPPEQWAVPRALRGETSRNSEYTLRRKDSGETWVGSYSFAPIRDGSGAIVGSVVTGRDITEHKRADEALRDREELLRLFIEYAPAPLAMFDREMRYLYVSRRWKSDYHLGEQDLRGLSHYEVFPEISGEWKEIHRRGQMGEIIRSDNDRFQREDGSVQWLRWEVRPWRDAAGSVGGILIFSEDITDQRRQEEELREKNLELERLNYTVSHDLKSPLVTVKTFLGYLELDLAKGDSSRIGQDMMYMRTAAERMSNLLDDLFDFSRLGKTSWPPVDVSFTEIAREAVNLVAGRISQRGVKIELADSPVMLHGDRQRLLQLWQNLVENSVKFMGEQAAPRIEVGVKCGAAKEKVFFVMDNGQGIDPRYKEKIFGLFEQLDPGIEGTGIGLALVKRIVELYGGALWMESEGPCKGTTFFFTLPKAIKNM
jgi:PAS domain S-box-containing protein